jgi:hypothetical protein
MAALAATAMAEAAIRGRGYFDKFENRLSSYGALKAYLDNAEGLVPAGTIRRIKNSSNARSIVFPVMNKATLTVITVRSCTIAGVEPISVKPTVAWITRGFEIKIYPKVATNNYISLEDQFQQGLLNGWRSVLTNLDTFAAARLDSQKSTSLVSTNLDGVNIVGNAYQVDPDQRDDLYMIMPTLLNRNDLNGGGLNNIATTESQKLMLKYETFGENNSQNLRAVLNGDLPYSSGFRHYFSNRVTNGTGVAETHFLTPAGAIGVFTANDSDAVNKVPGPNGKTNYLFDDPVMGITWDVQEEPICDDMSATYGAGYERTDGTKYQIAADFGFLEAYSSDTSKAILKVELLQTP